MNWLNAVDNILDGAFAPNQETDEDTASNYGSSVTSADHLNDSGTWSDDDSDHHPRLAFTVSEDVIDEEDEAEIAEEDGDEKGEKTEQKSSAKAIAQNPTKPRSTLGMVRPGNIRVMHKRSMSSSSSGEEKDEDSNINSEKISDNESNSDARENGKPAPISLAEEDSILPKKPDFDDTEENSPLKLAIQKESSDNTPVQNKDNPVQTPTTMHSSDFIKKPIDTNSNSVSKPPQQKEIVPSESFHGQEEEDNDIINPQKVDNQSPPQSPQESRIISEIDEASQHLENTPVLTNRSQGATADPRPVPGERSSVKKRNHNCPEIIDHQVEAMSAELEELKAQFDGIVRKEPDPFLGDETENSPEEEMPQSATAIVTVMPTEEPQPDHSLAPSNENYSVRQDSDKGKDEDDDMFEDAVHESDSPGGDIAQTDNSEKISTEGSTTSTSEKIEEKASSVLFDSVVMADSITPQQSNDWSNQRELQLADSEETPLRGVRLSEITLPATNINESLIAVEGVDEVNNDSKPDENSFDDGSIDMNGISEDSKLRQTNATGSSDANSVTSESGNEKAYSRSTSSNDLDQDSALSPGKADLVRSSVHFDVKKALGSWEEDPSEAGMEFKDINRYGAFHIRVLRAQRLPCPVGSTVQASVSLLPWKGRFRSERRATFVLDQESSPSFDHGVCVQWDDKKGDASATISLIHAYAGDATPVPTILINLVLSPVKMLQFSMCSLTLPCDALMKTPGKWRRQWFLAEMQERKNDNDNKLFSEEQTALVEVEAVFVPDDQRFGSSFVSIGQSRAVQDHDEDESSNASNSAEIPEAKTPLATNAEQDNEDDNFIAATKPHLMRVHRFWKPASCSLCSKSLMGWGKQSFRCEVCGLDCCSDCRLHVDLQLPCGSEKATERTGKLIQNKLTISSFLETMAPVDDSYEQKKRELSTIDGDTSLTDTRSLTTHTTRGDRGRIGVMKMNIARACVFESILPATTEPDELVKHTGALRPGDYYVRVCRTGAEGSARTRTIPSPGRLKFEESNEMRLDV